MTDSVRDFLARGPWAVVGASRDGAKFGNRVLRAYLRHGLRAYPVHPSETEVEGERAYPDLAALPETPRGVSIVTPPPVTERIVEEAAEVGARWVWMQPGAESARAVRRAEGLGLGVIAGGPCLLVEIER